MPYFNNPRNLVVRGLGGPLKEIDMTAEFSMVLLKNVVRHAMEDLVAEMESTDSRLKLEINEYNDQGPYGAYTKFLTLSFTDDSVMGFTGLPIGVIVQLAMPYLVYTWDGEEKDTARSTEAFPPEDLQYLPMSEIGIELNQLVSRMKNIEKSHGELIDALYPSHVLAELALKLTFISNRLQFFHSSSDKQNEWFFRYAPTSLNRAIAETDEAAFYAQATLTAFHFDSGKVYS